MAGSTISGDWQVQLGSLLIGSGTPYGLVRIDGVLDLPPVDSNDQSLPDQDGARRGGDKVRARTITLTVEVDPSEVGSRELIDALVPNVETEFACQLPVLAEGLMQWSMVKMRRRYWPLDLQAYYGLPIVRIELNAADPRLYGQTMSASVAGSGSTSMEGVALDWSFWMLKWPLVWATQPIVADNETLSLTNSGNVPTDAVFVVSGAEVSPLIQNLDTGTYLGWEGELLEGERLTFDTGTKRLTSTARSESEMFAGIVGDWFQFPRGTTRLQLQDLSETATPTLLARWASATM